MDEPQANLEPRDAAEALSALVATSSDALALVSQGEIRLASPPLATLLGYDSPNELVGLRAGALVAPADAAALDSALRGDEPATKLTGRRRDGSELPIDLSAAGPAGARLLRLRDLRPGPTDALYRAMFEVNTAVKLLIDPRDGRIVDANAAAVELYGWSLEELRSMRITDINTLDPDMVHEELEHARRVNRTFFRFEHRTARGSVRHVEVHTGPVTIEGRDYVLSIVHDVTERDAFEEQLRRAQRFETVGRLAGGVAHDFNNLLTIMSTSCELIGRHVAAGSPARPFLDDLTGSIRRASTLTRQLLALGSRQVMRERTVELPALIRRMERLLRQTLGAGMTLSVELGAVPPVHADPGQLEQVILNLVLNARDAMPEGGTLTVRTGTRVVGPEGAPGLAPGRHAVLTVEDTGEGMDDATRAQIFDPFFTTRGDSGGTGLGLSMVYGIVAQSEGQVEVRSEVGRGSVFDVHLPASTEPVDDEAEPESAPWPETPADGERPLVALVEDSDGVRRVLAEALERSGFRVAPFPSGDEALAWSEAQLASFAAVLSDVVMPGTSGVELARALHRRRPELPFVLVSGDLSAHVRATVPPDTVFLQKPFSVEELVGTLRAALGPRATPTGGA